MRVEIIKSSKTEIEVEVESDNPTIFELITGKLENDEEVEFTSYNWEHPLIKKQRFYIKVKKGNALEKLKKVVDEIKKELKEIKEQISL